MTIPKIKNWSKVGEKLNLRRYPRHVLMLWRHDTKPIEVAILQEDEERIYRGKPPYGVVAARVTDSGFDSIAHDSFQKKADAKTWAVEWMRNHPNPR